jgi:Flp pilus assembly pilin Flp
MIKKLLKNRIGATALEYGIKIATITVVLIVAVSFFGTSSRCSFYRIASNMQQANSR